MGSGPYPNPSPFGRESAERPAVRFRIQDSKFKKQNSPGSSMAELSGLIGILTNLRRGGVSWMDETEVMWCVEQTFQLFSKRTNLQGNKPEVSSRIFSPSPGFTRAGSK